MTSLETRPLVAHHPRTNRNSAALPTAAPYRHDDFDIAIVGLGYVGLPTALAYHHAGARVLGLEISRPRMESIRTGHVDLLPSDRERLDMALADAKFTVSDDPALLRRAGAIIVCVPTPVDHHLVPDLSILRSACDAVVANAVPGQIVILTSTSYVGCTRGSARATPRRTRPRARRDISVAFSPERIDPGNELDRARARPAGRRRCDAELPSSRPRRCSRRYTASVHRVDSLAAAEMTKLLENTFRAVNIALANEFADICRELDVPVTNVIDAAATKPYGFMPFLPGPGVGGHCIPCDPALPAVAAAREADRRADDRAGHDRDRRAARPRRRARRSGALRQRARAQRIAGARRGRRLQARRRRPTGVARPRDTRGTRAPRSLRRILRRASARRPASPTDASSSRCRIRSDSTPIW